MRVVLAVTGASGVILGQRLCEVLLQSGHEVHLIVSRGAEKVGSAEGAPGFEHLKTAVRACYGDLDFDSPLASSSFRFDCMAICPCSMKTLSAVANGFADTLVARAAESCLKLGRPLALVVRETPLSLPALENMVAVKRAGAFVVPPVLGFYSKPRRVEDLIDFVVGKVLDCLRIDHKLYRRWGE